MNGFKDDLLWYTNFVSNNRGERFVRKRYNLIDLLRQIGGMVGALKIMAFVFVQPFVYKKN